MKDQSQPLPFEIIQRYWFNMRIQQPHETVSTYLSLSLQLWELLERNA